MSAYNAEKTLRLSYNDIPKGLIDYVPNRVLTMLENRILNLNLSEYHTGYRAFSRAILESVNYKNNSDWCPMVTCKV